MRLALLFIGYYGSFEFSTGKMKATKKTSNKIGYFFLFTLTHDFHRLFLLLRSKCYKRL